MRKQQGEVEHKLEVVCKTEADAKAEAKHAQLRYEDRDHELNERAALLRRQETELVRQAAGQVNAVGGTEAPVITPEAAQFWGFSIICMWM